MTSELNVTDGYLTGHLLLAMPTMSDPRFERTVIYMCAHGPEGAIGLVINRLIGSLSFPDLLTQLDIEINPEHHARMPNIHFGGPVETERGFVLHTSDYRHDGTMWIAGDIALTANIDILRDIAAGRGPRQHILTLGYAGWGPGQLEGEIQGNAWLCAPCEDTRLFDSDLDEMWNRVLADLGVEAALLSTHAGRA